MKRFIGLLHDYGIFLIMHIFIIGRLTRFFNIDTDIIIPSSVVLFCIVLGAFYLAERFNSKLAIKYIEIFHYYVGVIYASVIVQIIVTILDLFIPITESNAYIYGVLSFGASSIMVVFGLIYFYTIKIQRIQYASPKVQKPIKIAMIVDVQLGSINKFFFDRVIRNIVRINPDIVVIPGDMFDSGYIDEGYLSPLKRIRVPMIMTYGNHEFTLGEKKIEKILKKTNIQLLRNKKTHIEGIDVLGIDDTSSSSTFTRRLKSLTKETGNIFQLLLFHRPKYLNQAEERGIDLVLTGHTHNGQMFPFVMNLFYPLNNALSQRENTYLYNSPGTGLWGPKMRLGSRNEITVIDIVPGKKTEAKILKETLSI